MVKHGRKWRKTELTGLRGQTADIYTLTAQETDKRSGERRFQLQSPINRKHLTPHFSTLNTDQMMINN